jgi:hypothetical protein
LSELLIGCGSSRVKKLAIGDRKEWSGLVTLDYNADHSPDIVYDMAQLPLPFADDSFDEVHAYECLEHVGTQGDFRFFFAQFSDFWRILRPRGVLLGTVPLPTSAWAWGDPSHTRVIPKESFVFLCQPQYDAQIGKTAMSDFRFCYRADFDVVHLRESGDSLEFGLIAVKPSRITL